MKQMLQTKPPVLHNLLAVLDALAELGQAVTESQEKQTTDSDNPSRETLSAVERQPSTNAEGDHD